MAETDNIPGSAAANNGPVPQPGTVVAPGSSGPVQAVPLPTAAAAQPPPTAVIPPAGPAPALPPAAPPAPQPPPAAEEPLPKLDLGPLPNENDNDTVTWTASEFVAREKSSKWYLKLAIATVLVAILTFVIARDLVSVSVIIIAGILLGIYGTHQPRQREYQLDQLGIGIAGNYHSYDEFRSFTVAPEEAFAGIVLMPLKRFAVPLTIYYAPEDEEKILTILSDHLPFEEYRGDAVEDLMRHIRF